MQRDGERVKCRVFLTYGDVDKAIVRAMEIDRFLKDEGLSVCTETKEAKIKSLNVNEWLEDALEKNDFIVICVDKTYKEFACQNVPTEKSDNEKNKTEKQYIFNLAQIKIVHEGMLNRKFIPVLIDGARHEDLPLVLQSTVAYQWPAQQKHLLNRLLGIKEFVPPELGATPTPIFERV